MCTVLLPPGGYPIGVNKYININNVFVTVQQELACNDNTFDSSEKRAKFYSCVGNVPLGKLGFFYDTAIWCGILVPNVPVL
jgi:hypothetical protein